MQEREYIKVLGKGIRNSLAREKVIQEYEDHIVCIDLCFSACMYEYK